MKLKRFPLPWLAVLAVSPGWGRARLETAVDPGDILIGRPFQVRVTVVTDPGDAVLPLQPNLPSPFELVGVSSAPVQKTAVDQRQDWILSLRLFEVGVSTLPALTVKTRRPKGAVQTVDTPAILVTVKSVLTEKDQQFHGMKGGLKKVLDRRRLAALLIALGLAGLLGYFLRWRKPRSPRPVGPPPRPAHTVALEALSGLEGDPTLADKPYYSRLTEILRQYMEGRFAVPAMDQTTAETLAALKTLDLSPDRRRALRDVLEHSDLAKFAKGVLTPEERTGDLARVRDFVESTRPAEGHP